MQFEFSTDARMIKEIVTNPLIWPAVSDDFSGEPEDWKANTEAAMYLMVHDGEELLGMFCLVPTNRICWAIHTCLLPCAWGTRARTAAKELISWVFENTMCLRLITDVPAYNTLAYRFAVTAGLKEFGRNVASYMKDGTLHDVVMMGISKGDTCQ